MIQKPNNEVELIVVDEKEMTIDQTIRPSTGAARRSGEEYLTKLKKYRPKEYEELMKNAATERR